MSLRDLATTSLCAPTEAGPSSANGASSSANPLAQLAEVVLPSSLAPGRQNTSTPALQNVQSHVNSAAKERHTLESDAILIHATLNPENQPLSSYSSTNNVYQPRHTLPYKLPQAIFSSALTKGKPSPLPFPPPVQPSPFVPIPEVGAPTDVFERAFDAASKQVSASSGPRLGVDVTPVPPVSYLPIPPHPHPGLINPLSQFPYHSRFTRPSWRLNSAFSTLSLQPGPSTYVHPTAPVQTGPVMEVRATPHLSSAEVEGAQNVTVESEVAETAPELTKEQNTAGHILPSSSSWGEEFTSLEGLAMNSHSQSVDVIDDFFLDDTLHTAFQHWLRRDFADNYHFPNREYELNRRSSLQALQEGVQAHGDGRLSAAVFHLEDALNRSETDDPLPSQKRALAWYVLGISLADLDDDERAIQALLQGLKVYDGSKAGHRREDNPYLWQSLISLAVSFTNELEHTKALRCIREWLELRGSINAGDSESGIASTLPNIDLFRQSDHDDLLHTLNRISREAPSDLDAFIVLGILHNLNRDYQAAAIALRHAVTLRPNMPNLWNKLGATLANGGNSDEALRSYRKAVDLQPKLVRAWVNVGTAYANRGEHEKAMRYYLKAITMSDSGNSDNCNGPAITESSDSSLHVWGYIRNTLLSMSRSDLIYLVDNQDIENLKASFGF